MPMPTTKPRSTPLDPANYPVGTGIALKLGEFTSPRATHTVIGHDQDGYLRIFPTFEPYTHANGNRIVPLASRITPDPARIERR